MPARRATTADLEPLVGLASEYAAVTGRPLEESHIRRAVEPLLASDDHGVAWVIEDHGSLLGYAVVTWGWSVESGGRDALLDEIYVRRQGTGRGSAILEAIFADLESRGIRRIFLETESGNSAARRLYSRHGFQVEDSIWMSREI